MILKLKNKNIRVLGTVLWSEIPESAMEDIRNGLNDYSLIYTNEDDRISVNQSHQLFEKNLKWIVDQVNESTQSENEECLVLSHHCPTMKGTSAPKFSGGMTNHAFSSSLENLFIGTSLENQQKMGLKNKSNIKTWICGHTHWNFDLNIKGTRVVSNQRGYFFEQKNNFDPEFSINF